MSNPYRVVSSTQSGCISKGNFQIGVRPINFGPSAVTNFYAGINPPSGGYAWYKSSGAGAHIRTAADDQTLVNIVNEEFQQGFTQASSAIRYINSNSNQYVTNIAYPSIITDGLILHYDAGFVSSYPRVGATWSDVSGFSRNGAILNNPTFDSSNNGSLVFDGIDDYVNVTNLNQILLNTTWLIWIKRNGTQVSYAGLFYNRNTLGSGLGFSTSDQLSYSWNNASNTWGWNTGLVPPNGAWCMCAVTVNSTEAVMYLCQSSGTTTASNTVSHGSATIDTVRVAYDGLVNRYFKGSFGIASLYNRVLSGAEIQENFNAVKSRYGL